ncbi:MAG TPA: ABC transporter permease [Mycobacteriales bacterium]|nr:ABC transporter permease [Mycobacteriales bacterium]
MTLRLAPTSKIGDGFSWLSHGSSWTGSGGLLHLAGRQLIISAESLALALVVAVPVGLALGHIRKGGSVVTALGNLGRAVPTIGILILLSRIGAFGVRERTAVIALAIFGLPPILTNTYTATAAVDDDTIDAARGMGMKPGQVLTRVELPLALPLIAAGVRTAAVQVFATATLASYVGDATLGLPIEAGNNQQLYDQVVGTAVVVAVLALALDVTLGRVQALLTPGSPGPVWRRVLPAAWGGAGAPRRPAPMDAGAPEPLPTREVEKPTVG